MRTLSAVVCKCSRIGLGLFLCGVQLRVLHIRLLTQDCADRDGVGESEGELEGGDEEHGAIVGGRQMEGVGIGHDRYANAQQGKVTRRAGNECNVAEEVVLVSGGSWSWLGMTSRMRNSF